MVRFKRKLPNSNHWHCGCPEKGEKWMASVVSASWKTTGGGRAGLKGGVRGQNTQ